MDFLIHHLLRTTALRLPDQEALVYKQQRLTYGEVAQKTASLALGLRNCGLQKSDKPNGMASQRLGIYLDASIAQVLSIFAISQAGGVFVPINTLLFPQQVVHIANDCQMKGLITTASKLAALGSVIKEMTALEFVVVVQDRELPEISLPTYDFERLCQLETPAEWFDWAIEKDLASVREARHHNLFDLVFGRGV